MSHAYFIASDYELAKPSYEDLNFLIFSEYYSPHDVPKKYTDKKHIYNVDFKTHEMSVQKIISYLTENMKPDSEVEIWSMWLGSPFCDSSAPDPKIKNMSPKEYAQYIDDIHWYNDVRDITFEKIYIYLSDIKREHFEYLYDHMYTGLIITNKGHQK